MKKFVVIIPYKPGHNVAFGVLETANSASRDVIECDNEVYRLSDGLTFTHQELKGYPANAVKFYDMTEMENLMRWITYMKPMVEKNLLDSGEMLAETIRQRDELTKMVMKALAKDDCNVKPLMAAALANSSRRKLLCEQPSTPNSVRMRLPHIGESQSQP